MKKLCIVTFVLFMFSALVFAQLKTADITGTALMPDGTTIPGVSITLTGDMIGKKVTVTSENGSFRFGMLPPGIYQLQFDLDGFKSIIQKDIRLLVGKDIRLNVQMETSTINEVITVVGKTNVVDMRKANMGVNVTKEQMQSLPTARNPWTIVAMVPGMMLDRPDVGGAESGQQSNFYGLGVDRFDTQWSMDGSSNTDQAALGGSFGYQNTNAMEEIQVSIGSNDIRAFTGGTQINFITKRGGNRYSGDFYLNVEDASWELKQDAAYLAERKIQQPGVNRLMQYGFNFGGPILKDHVWFMGSYGIQDIHARTEQGIEDTSWLLAGYAKLTFQFGNTSGMYNVAYNDKKKWGRAAVDFVSQAPSSLWDQHGTDPVTHHFQLQQVLGNLMLEAKVLLAGGGFELLPKGNSFTNNTLTGQDLWVWYYPNTYYPGGYYYALYERPTKDFTLDGNYFASQLLGGDHEIRFGAQYFWASSRAFAGYPNQRELYRRTDYKYTKPGLTVPYTNAFEADTDYDYTESITRLGFYLSDTISFKRLTANIGVRYDKERGKINDVLLPALNMNGITVPEWANILGEKRIPGFESPAIWETFSPRISLSYDITGEGKFLVKLSAARYPGAGGFYTTSRARTGLIGTRWIMVPWTDTNANSVPDLGEFTAYTPAEIDALKIANKDNGQFMGYGGFNPNDPLGYTILSKFDANYSAPLTDELILTLEREVFDNFALSLSGFYRKYHNEVFARNYWLIDGQVVVEGIDNIYDKAPATNTDPVTGREVFERKKLGFTGVYYDNFKKSYSRFMGLQLIATKKLSNRWMGQFSISYSDSKMKYDRDEYFLTNGRSSAAWSNFSYYNDGVKAPETAASGLDGVFVNSRWQFKLNAMYQLPWGLNFSTIFTAQEGYVVPQHVVAFKGNNMMPEGTHMGDDRLTTLWLLNLGLEKSFKINENMTFTVFVDAYNVTNENTVLKKNLTLDATTKQPLGNPLKVTNAGIFQFGIRANF